MDTPRSGAHVVAAAAIERGQLTELVAEVAKVAQSGIVLDLRGQSTWSNPSDRAFLELTGASDEQALIQTAMVCPLLATWTGEKDVSLILPEGDLKEWPDRLKAAGFNVMQTAQTLEEALSSGSMILLSRTLREAAGGEKAWGWLVEMLTQRGIAIADESSLSLAEAAALLGPPGGA
jgi:hypothetical protein